MILWLVLVAQIQFEHSRVMTQLSFQMPIGIKPIGGNILIMMNLTIVYMELAEMSLIILMVVMESIRSSFNTKMKLMPLIHYFWIIQFKISSVLKSLEIQMIMDRLEMLYSKQSCFVI